MAVKMTPARKLTVPPIAPAPARFHAPWTVGRVLYFAVLATLLSFGAVWLAGWLRFVTSTGVVERDVDRLAPRERGRITRIAVRAGERVRAGQPLVWFDDGDDGGFLSDAAARANAHDAELAALRQRRQEIDRLAAQARTQLAGWHATELGLDPQLRTLAATHDSARRLRDQGAATEAEVAQVRMQLQQLEQQGATAHAQSHAQRAVLRQLRAEAESLDAELKEKRPAPRPADVGVLAASRDGVVAAVVAHTGEVVGPDSAVVLLADAEHVRVRAFVAPRDAASFAAGQRVEVRLPSGETLHGQVARLDLLASIALEAAPPSLGKPQQPTLTAQAAPPVDPNAAFLLAEIAVRDVPAELAARLAAGAPCEVRVARSWRWLVP